MRVHALRTSRECQNPDSVVRRHEIATSQHCGVFQLVLHCMQIAEILNSGRVDFTGSLSSQVAQASRLTVMKCNACLLTIPPHFLSSEKGHSRVALVRGDSIACRITTRT